MTFGELLRHHRISKGLTQSELAARCDLTASQVSQYELRGHNPRWATVQRLATSLGLSVLAFADGDGIASPPRRFAHLLLRERESAGLTQQELAARSGVHVATISGYESGALKVGWDAVRLLAKGLGVSLLAFLEDPDPSGDDGVAEADAPKRVKRQPQ